MYSVGECVRWRAPLDADYSYGIVLAVRSGYLKIRGSGYYDGVITHINLQYIDKGGNDNGGKEHNKR